MATATAPTPADGVRDPAGITDSIKGDRERDAEQVELHGDALDLFRDRYTDTFSVERHGHQIEFYRPVDATKADPASIRENDPGLADQLERGSRLLDEWRDRQQAVMRAHNDPDVDTEDILEQFTEAGELLCGVLSAHAVDDSFEHPGVWEAIFPNGEAIRELFEDFFSEGASSSMPTRRT